MGWKASTAPTPQPRYFNHLDEVVGWYRKGAKHVRKIRDTERRVVADSVKDEPRLRLQKIVTTDGAPTKGMFDQLVVEKSVGYEVRDRCWRYRAIGDALATIFDFNERFEPCETARTVSNNGGACLC